MQKFLGSLKRFFSIHYWKGRDKRGVPVLVSPTGIPSNLYCFFWVITFTIALYIYFTSLSAHIFDYWVRLIFGWVLPAAIFIDGSRLIRLRLNARHIAPANKIGARFGLLSEEVEMFAQEKGIKPLYNINGQDYYKLADFGDAATLVRASAEPISQPEILLRPAAASETLLRASVSQESNS